MYYHLHQIGKIGKHLTKEACATAVNSLVLARLDYNNGLLCELPSTCSELYCSTSDWYTQERTHHPVLRASHWLPVKERIMYKVLLVTFKVVHGIRVPEYLASLLEPYTPPRSLRSETQGLLNVPKVSRKVGEAFQVVTPRY